MLQLPGWFLKGFSTHTKMSLPKGFGSIVSSMQNSFPNVIGNDVCDTVCGCDKRYGHYLIKKKCDILLLTGCGHAFHLVLYMKPFNLCVVSPDCG